MPLSLTSIRSTARPSWSARSRVTASNVVAGRLTSAPHTRRICSASLVMGELTPGPSRSHLTRDLFEDLGERVVEAARGVAGEDVLDPENLAEAANGAGDRLSGLARGDGAPD